MHIYYLSVSINILNLISIHTTTIICMGIVTATAGLWAAKGLWQFVPVLWQSQTVCDSRRVTNCLCQPCPWQTGITEKKQYVCEYVWTKHWVIWHGKKQAIIDLSQLLLWAEITFYALLWWFSMYCYRIYKSWAHYSQRYKKHSPCLFELFMHFN